MGAISWAVGRYVIMPDHVHLFGRPQPGATKLSEFIEASEKLDKSQDEGIGWAAVSDRGYSAGARRVLCSSV